jgi:hypothetical protein
MARRPSEQLATDDLKRHKATSTTALLVPIGAAVCILAIWVVARRDTAAQEVGTGGESVESAEVPLPPSSAIDTAVSVSTSPNSEAGRTQVSPLATAFPERASRGDGVTIRPLRPVQPFCADVVDLRLASDTSVVVAQAVGDRWISAEETTVTYLACLSTETDLPKSFDLPDVAPGAYVACMSAADEGCAFITIE